MTHDKLLALVEKCLGLEWTTKGRWEIRETVSKLTFDEQVEFTIYGPSLVRYLLPSTEWSKESDDDLAKLKTEDAAIWKDFNKKFGQYKSKNKSSKEPVKEKKKSKNTGEILKEAGI